MNKDIRIRGNERERTSCVHHHPRNVVAEDGKITAEKRRRNPDQKIGLATGRSKGERMSNIIENMDLNPELVQNVDPDLQPQKRGSWDHCPIRQVLWEGAYRSVDILYGRGPDRGIDGRPGDSCHGDRMSCDCL